MSECHDTITTLLDTHPTITEDATLLHAAAEYANEAVVNFLLQKGFDINGLSQHGRTLLHHYALHNDTAQIHSLLSRGARTDIRDSSYHSTAAGFAPYSASYNAMRLILDSSNCLLEVISCAYLQRAKVLVENNPGSIHQQTGQGNTVLHIVGMWLHDEPDYELCSSLVKWLVEEGADINAKNKNIQTPVQFNLANGADTLAELLADYH